MLYGHARDKFSMKRSNLAGSVSTKSPPGGPPRGSRNHQSHGLYSMKNALVRSKQVRLDMRYRTGKALVRWRLELVQDLGGEDAISTQQAALIELCVRSKLMIDTVDNWILSQDSLVNKKKKSLLPVVAQRQSLADGLAKYLGQLGLERRVKEKTLEEYINETYGDKGSG